MLNKLIIKNINSISVCEIDFKKEKYKFLEENINGDIVNPISIYGHNGSGKSSVIKAIQQLVSLMNEPATNLRPFIVNNFLFEEYHKTSFNILSASRTVRSLISSLFPSKRYLRA